MAVMGLLVVLGFIVDILFIRAEYAGKMKQATVLKGLASFFFVLLGLIFYVSGHNNTVATLILLGLIFGMLGDIFLNLRNLYEGATSNKIFAVGILLFLIGHFMYIAALLVRDMMILPWNLAVMAVLTGICVPPLMKKITAPSKGLKTFGYVYLTIVILMFASAATLLILDGAGGFEVLFALGALLFVVSDFIMIYYSFGKKIKPLRAVNLLTYYAGQMLIAFCILFGGMTSAV